MSGGIERLSGFATNRPDKNQSVADEVNLIFRYAREVFAEAAPLAIATAYINASGFTLLADELEASPRVRLLLGAEPEVETAQAISLGDLKTKKRFDAIAESHDSWLRSERDLISFTKESHAQARRLVEWLKSQDQNGLPRVEVRRFTKGFLHGKAYIANHPQMPVVLAGSSNLTFAGLKLNAEINLGYPGGDREHAQPVIDWFDEYWDQSETYDLAAIHEAAWEPHAPIRIFFRMLLELYGDHLADEEAVNSFENVPQFQLDGINRMRRLLAENNGVLLADEVGLGKTYMAAAIIRDATEINRQRVLIICPASLKESMWEAFLKKNGFRLYDVITYDEARTKMNPEHPSHLDFVSKMQDYALVVVDEAHNLKNSGTDRAKAIDRVILAGKVAKKVLLITATPVNNSLMDLATLIKYFVRDDAKFAHVNIPSIEGYIRRAQEIDPESLTPDHLFDLMDQIAVRRTRKFVKEQYPNEQIMRGNRLETIKFPTPRVRRIDYTLDKQGSDLLHAVLDALRIDENDDLYSAYTKAKNDSNKLLLARYTPSRYKISLGSVEKFQIQNAGLLRSALLKRMESSPQALLSTLSTLEKSHINFIRALDSGLVLRGEALRDFVSSESENIEEFLEELDQKQLQLVASAEDYYQDALRADANSDLELIRKLIAKAKDAASVNGSKFEALVDQLTNIAADALRPSPLGLSETDRRKVIVFSTFADTVQDVHGRLLTLLTEPRGTALDSYRGRVAPSQYGGKSGSDQTARAAALSSFAPKTAGRLDENDLPISLDKFDILVTTDVLAEGVNLQQASHIINYDLPWNPMRIVQRHGRIDRLFSEHDEVFMGLFYPADALEEMLGLQRKLEAKLARAEAAVGAVNVLPGREVDSNIIHHDSPRVIEDWESILIARGGNRAISGEEYRRRLYREATNNRGEFKEIQALPYGSGSGFVNENFERNGFVFCVKIGHESKPWLRYIEVDENWKIPENQAPVISSESLLCLLAADPKNQATERVLSDEAVSNAYYAWDLIRSQIFFEWQELTDPNTFIPDLPPAFREASQLVRQYGAFLGEKQSVTLSRLNVVPNNSVVRELRKILNQALPKKELIAEIINLLDAEGIQPPVLVKPVDAVSESEIRLVSWMAVSGKKSSRSTAAK